MLRDDDAAPTVPARRPSIRHLVAALRDAGMRLDADVQELDDMPADVGLTAYRIVEEALTNAQKYGAGTATLRVEVAAAMRSSIDVANPVPEVLGQRPRTDGLGLIGMRERAEASGETLDSRSETAPST